jgi:hypothetical protein
MKITPEQLRKLIFHLSFLDDKAKGEFLLKCGFYHQYSELIRTFALIRIDREDFAWQVSNYQFDEDQLRVRGNPTYTSDGKPSLSTRLFNNGAYIYRRFISTDTLNIGQLGMNNIGAVDSTHYYKMEEGHQLPDYNRYIDLDTVL